MQNNKLLVIGATTTLFFIVLASFAQGQQKEPVPQERGVCILVSGWRTADISFDSELNEIVDTLNWQYPDISFRGQQYKWNSFNYKEIFNYSFLIEPFKIETRFTYLRAAQNAESASSGLARFIEQLPASEQKNVILVGHSLGCRVIVKSFSYLQNKGIKIKQTILFAAAIPENDAEIDTMISCCEEPVLSFIHPRDGALMSAVFAEKKSILGLGSSSVRKKLKEYLIEANYDLSGRLLGVPPIHLMIGEYIPNHEIQNFIFSWKQSVFNFGVPVVQDIIVYQGDKRNVFFMSDANMKKLAMDIDNWHTIDSIQGWKLQQQNTFFRILAPVPFQLAIGSEHDMSISFKKIKQQLNNKVEDDFPKIPNGIIAPGGTAPHSIEKQIEDGTLQSRLVNKRLRIWNSSTEEWEYVRFAKTIPDIPYEKEIESLARSAKEKKDLESLTNYGTLMASKTSDISVAIKDWEYCAERGYPPAMYELAICHLHGEAGLNDTKRAAEYLKKAADNGHINAMMALAQLSYEALLETKDETYYNVCKKYLTMAAEAGQAEAQFKLGFFMSAEGKAEEAFQWCRKAAHQGYTVAQFELGSMYYSNNGVPDSKYNKAFALMWFKKAAVKGYAQAAYNAALLHIDDPKNDTIRYDKEEAKHWLKIAVKDGNKDAKELLDKLNSN